MSHSKTNTPQNSQEAFELASERSSVALRVVSSYFDVQPIETTADFVQILAGWVILFDRAMRHAALEYFEQSESDLTF